MKMAYIILLYCPLLHPIFEYDRAVFAGQKGDWEKAMHLLTDVIIHNPDNTQAMYDAGVAAYREKQFQQSVAYFTQAAESSYASLPLKEQALFNAGNAYVEQKMLPEAIVSYEKTLALNAANERAAHNLALVKKMLEEQQQKNNEQQKNQDEKQKDQNQDKQQDDQAQDQKNQDQNKGDTSGSSGNKPPSGNGKQSDNDANENNAQQQNPGSQKESGNKNRKQFGNDSKDAQPHNNAQRNGVDEAKDDSNGDNGTGNANRGKEHSSTPQQQRDKKAHDSSNPTAVDKKAQQSASLSTAERKDKYAQDGWLTHILQEQEKADAHLTKRMIRANVGNQLAGQHGQNCW